MLGKALLAVGATNLRMLSPERADLRNRRDLCCSIPAGDLVIYLMLRTIGGENKSTFQLLYVRYS